MTVVVTRDVADRFRGFVASCMLEIAPGVYTAPGMNPAARDQVWRVLEGWFHEIGGGSIVMTWTDKTAAAGQSVRVLGLPPVEIVNYDGFFLSFRRSTNGKKAEEVPENNGL